MVEQLVLTCNSFGAVGEPYLKALFRQVCPAKERPSTSIPARDYLFEKAGLQARFSMEFKIPGTP
jgi:hypothetical protein